MTADGRLTAEHAGRLGAVDEAVARTMARVIELTTRSYLGDTDLVDLAVLSSNAGHVLNYVEGNQRHFGRTAVETYRERLLGGLDVEAALTLLAGPPRRPAEAEWCRRSLLSWLDRRIDHATRPWAAAVSARYADAHSAVEEIGNAQADLLGRLGLPNRGAAPGAVFYRVVSTTTNPATRAKLVQAWEAQRTMRLGPLMDRLDDVVQLRRAESARKGDGSPLDDTLRHSHLSEARMAAFIDAYVERAADAAAQLAARISAVTGATDHPLDHFGAYARALVGSASLPTFALDGCLDFLATMARDVFGIVLVPVPSGRPDEQVVVGYVDGRPVGVATFDLLGRPDSHSGFSPADRAASSDSSASGTPARATLPEARVLCRYQHDPDRGRVVSFESAHSICHEFGHVLNHWLLWRHTPSDTGLDYLPLERIEDLSAWSEKWVYHPRFAEHLGLSADDTEALGVCARIKRLEFVNGNLDRAIVAAVDFDVHRGHSGGVADALRRVEGRFRIDRLYRSGTVAGFLLWPLCRAYPGANLTYLWGAAFGAHTFQPWLEGAPAAADSRPTAAALRSCFDPDMPSVEPDLDPLFRFYDADG